MDGDDARQTPAVEAPWIPYSEIDQAETEWVVPGLVPRGMLTLLAGDPGIGKSMLGARYAAELSYQGRKTVLASAEDSPSHTTKKRLRALEADERLIYHAEALPTLPGSGEGGKNDFLERQAERAEADLLFFDPFTAMMAETHSSWSDQHVRRALGPLAELAMRLDIGIIYVLHLNKAQGTNALMRIGGSIGFSAAARSVVLMAVDPSDERGLTRFVAHAKCNVAELHPTLRYEIEPILLPATTTSTPSGETRHWPETKTARLKYKGLSDLAPADLLAVRATPEERTELEEAMVFLGSELADGSSVKVRDLENAARAAGISQRTLERARRELGVKPKRVLDHWEVYLPESSLRWVEPVTSKGAS
jgi:hypothetical protein